MRHGPRPAPRSRAPRAPREALSRQLGEAQRCREAAELRRRCLGEELSESSRKRGEDDVVGVRLRGGGGWGEAFLLDREPPEK